MENPTQVHVLVIDDDPSMLRAISKNLERLSFQPILQGPNDLDLTIIPQMHVSVVLLDMRLGPLDGLTVLKEIKDCYPQVEVIIITGFASVDNAIRATRFGAFDYMEKPLDWSKMHLAINNAHRVFTLASENRNLKRQRDPDPLIYTSKEMERVKGLVEQVKDTDITVLLTGESGTGKELFARLLHRESLRKKGPLVSINCAALPDTLLESELFGFKKGAFTGAQRDYKGKFQQAHQGTLLLDEIGDMPLSIQAKLLRVLQEHSFSPLGSEERVMVDTRVVAATNKKLKERISQGLFREDLYYRLAAFTIDIPPLRRRKEDIPVLISFFLQQYNEQFNKDVKGVTPEALHLLKEHPWPGNIRELKNAIQRGVLLSRGEVLEREDLQEDLLRDGEEETLSQEDRTLQSYLEEKEREYIQRVLEEYRGNKKEAAAYLGISRKTLYKKIAKYSLLL